MCRVDVMYASGWFEDWKYFNANAHPLIVILNFGSKDHPCKSRCMVGASVEVILPSVCRSDGTNERRIDLFQAICVSLLGSFLVQAVNSESFLLNLLVLTPIFVSIPLTLFKKLAFCKWCYTLLPPGQLCCFSSFTLRAPRTCLDFMACPCTIHDGSAASDGKKACVCCMETCGKFAICITFCIALTLGITGLCLWIIEAPDGIWNVSSSVLRTTIRTHNDIPQRLHGFPFTSQFGSGLVQSWFYITVGFTCVQLNPSKTLIWLACPVGRVVPLPSRQI